ncbi:acetylglutamate kinase [Corallococcus sp. H22C18031201]|uniref:acetylglutamate kinase n=1 Tax=Citreicoccus inhibens TaxID=2849499 RepID=UPI000E74886B|nr:acetylglutamate kinase [Citreicoccus inhibens]MBU8899769.1 acetylglutamate kinase [Citreicoccus inhibens]RJS19171.1 acetylglutamate kinase [Corallococcus sp. H22C18031201]
MPLSPDPYAALRHAARYVRQFRRKTFVVKLGGPVLSDPRTRRAVCEQIALLWTFAIRPVVVHGGGPELDSLCDALHLPVEKVAGRRVTSAPVLDAAKMVLAGKLHTDLLADLQAAGVPAVGLSGVDAGLLKARKRPPVLVTEPGSTEGRVVDYGLVGDIESVDTRVVEHLRQADYVPVVAPLSGGPDGAVYNTNADTVAASLAVALNAEKLFFLVQVPGLLKDHTDPSSLITLATLADLASLEVEGRLAGGMRPKAHAIRHALVGGVGSVHLVSGMQSDALLEEVFTNEGSGTMVVREHPQKHGEAAQG